MTGLGRALAVCLLVATWATVGAVSALESGEGEPGDRLWQTAPDEFDPDSVVVTVDVRADGSAHWTVEQRRRLDSSGATREFQALRDQLRTNRTAVLAPFERRVRGMASEAQNVTGRAMVVENVSVEAYREEVPQSYGILVYQFRWYGFAATDDDLRAGDALEGSFLDEETTLIVSWPANGTVATVRPEPDERRDGAVVWHGPLTFASNEPRLVLESNSLSFGPDLTFDVGSNDVLLAMLTLGLFLGGTVVWWRRSRGDAEEEEADEDASPAEELPSATDDAAAGGVDPGETADGEAAARASAEDAASVEAIPEGPTPPPELLSNEERVLALLERRGGRLKQQTIVEEFDWSETKTSEVVSDLREAAEVDVYRLGRENVLALPEVGIEPGDDERAEDGGDGA